MKIFNLTEDSQVYTSNVYLVLGTWNSLDDINTLVDAGRDAAIIEKIYGISTGVGKRRVEQVVLTHSHYDHAGMLEDIRHEFQPRVYCWSPAVLEPRIILRNGQLIQMGECMFEVIHVPEHSSDSICLLCQEEGVLFSGDTPLRLLSGDLVFSEGYIHFLERLNRIDIKAIYPGHGQPITSECKEIIKASLLHARKGRTR